MPLSKINTLALADNAVVTADIANGAITSAKLASGVGGKVLQVVTSVFSSTASTTSTSYVTTGHSLSITPSSTSNKIYLNLSGGSSWNNNDVNYNRYFTIYRNSTNLSTDGNGFENFYANTLFAGSHSISYLDSPNTTSATTYTIYYKVQAGTSWYTHLTSGGNGVNVVLTAFEIAG